MGIVCINVHANLYKLQKIKSKNLHNLIGFKTETLKILLALHVDYQIEKNVFDFLCRLVFNLKILNCNSLICS